MGKVDNRAWDLKLSNLVMFCIHNKRFVGSSDSASAEEKKLYNWVRTQIGAYNRGTLSQYRIDRLNGFCPAILNSEGRDMAKAVTEQIKATYINSISPAMANSGMSPEKLKQMKHLEITSDSEALATLAWATIVISNYEDLDVTEDDRNKAIEILNAAEIIDDKHKISVRSKFARNLVIKLDTTFDVHSLYLLLAILGPDAAWRVVFNGTKQEQMCARIRELTVTSLDEKEMHLICTRYYNFKSLDDVATIFKKSKEEIKAIETSALNKLRTQDSKAYIINNIRELNGEKVSGGILTNFEMANTQAKIKSAIRQ